MMEWIVMELGRSFILHLSFCDIHKILSLREMQPRYWLAAGRPGVVMGDVPLLPDQTCRQCLILLHSTQMMCSFLKDVAEVWLF